MTRAVGLGECRSSAGVAWHGRVVRTSIWKDPVEGLVRVSSLNLEGDKQSDRSVHGGPEKAVYA